ncbi:hypothetical protein ACH437_03790 [Streptomyces xinghaiensis]|uniref:hypothetical protein n=1 Tax=Streptomyces xinghaiensis TaxID=1038928 RepID=UPI0037B78529
MGDEPLTAASDSPQQEDPGLSDEEFIGAAAVLLHQRGQSRTASLMLDVSTFRVNRQITDYEETVDYTSWNEYWDVTLEVEPRLIVNFDSGVMGQIRSALESVGDKHGMPVGEVLVHEVIPKIGPNWREQLVRELKGGRQTNQARRVRLEAEHPQDDLLHFTNEWEHRVYMVLKERQAVLPPDDTIGILPLPGMRVLGYTFEPDLMVTYRGRVGVIEVDGPHHKGRASADKSRERLLRNAGIHWVDRIDVRDSTSKQEVERLVTNFLQRLIR